MESADSVGVRRGIDAAFSAMPDAGMADAMAETPEQARSILLMAEARVRTEQAMERARAGKF